MMGSNNLSSCFQYEVRDQDSDKILNVKIYDKFLDLVGREYIHPVSSRINTVLCSGRQPGCFEKLIRKYQHVGLTRLEISVCHNALKKFSPWNPSVKTRWHVKMANAIDSIISGALNNPKALSMTYRTMSLPRMINHICNTEINILAVGKRLSWIINASTGHRNHFIGTKCVAGISHTACDTQ